MIEHDEFIQRQVNQIMMRLLCFEEGSLTLPKLINDVKALIEILPGEDSWKQEMRSQWLTWEVINAKIIHRRTKEISTEQQEEIAQSIRRMKDLLQQPRP
jgi:hypothetical protein